MECTEIYDAKQWSWKWITVSELLCRGACDFLYAKLTPDAAAGGTTLRDGEDANGTIIAVMLTAGAYNCEVSPRRPIYCRKGLFVDEITTAGVLVQWRERSSKEG